MDNKQDEIEQLEFDDEQEVKSTEPVEKINEPINQNRPIPNQQVAHHRAQYKYIKAKIRKKKYHSQRKYI